MSKKRLGFIIKSLPYKTEASKLAVTHAISSQTAEIYLEDGDSVEPVICFIGDGVFNCIKGQQSMKHYGITSIEQHIKNALLLDLKVMICSEDLEKFRIKKESVIMDASEMGGETLAIIASYTEIQKEMNAVDHLLFF
ncbi:MAG: DsrE family protein [Nitrospirae bacterium]|nr:DsrE family protein [Nitrospirota bacterium]